MSGGNKELQLNLKNKCPPNDCPKEDKINEETAFITVNEETDIQDTTVIDKRYDGLLSVIESLKEQLIAEKQKNLLLDRKTENLEKEVRAELCDEFNKMMVEIESGWEQRLQEEKDRASELSDWRINKMQEAYMEKSKKRKRSEDSNLDSDINELETNQKKICDLDFKLEEEKKETSQLKEQIKAMKEVHQKMMEDQVNERGKLTRMSFEMATQQDKFKNYEETITRLEAELKASNDSLIAQIADPKIKELEAQLEEHKKNTLVLLKEKTDLTTLLDEAGEEYQTKDEELTALNEQLLNIKVCNIMLKTFIL